MKKLLAAFWILALGIFMPSLAFAIPVVPGAFGFGMDTRAAYACGSNPTILKVKNLNDGGADSLRAALEASGPRVVVFETSGTIVLESDITINSPCITVAGQTAPSPGITVRGSANASLSAGGINIYTHDVLMQHLRIRPGDGGPVTSSTDGHDAIQIYTSDVYNVVMDHNSLSWAGGKLAMSYANNSNTRVTFWQNILSEALFRAKNVTENWANNITTSIGILIAGYSPNNTVTLYGNLFAHNTDRNPQSGEGGMFQFINNVVYDWGKDPAAYYWAGFIYTSTPALATIPTKGDFIGNTYIAGPGTLPFSPLYAVGVWNSNPGSAFFINDNVLDSTANPVLLYDDPNSEGYRVFSQIFNISGFTVLPGSASKAMVLSSSGARPADRDSVDTRVVNEVTNRTGTMGVSCPSLPRGPVPSISGRICSQSDVGGWPTLAVNQRTFNAPANPHTYASNGYTNLENVLHDAAAAVEGNGTFTPQPPPPPPIQLSLSYQGKNRDIVGQGDNATTGDGTMDGVFAVTIPTAKTITSLSLTANDNTFGSWNTTFGDGPWFLGVASSPTGSLLNTSSLNYSAAANSTFSVFASGSFGSTAYFSLGSSVTLTATFSDGSTGSGTFTIPIPPSASGTRIPSATSIVDNESNTWTLSGTSIFKNGATGNGGMGSKLLWYQNVLYALGTDNTWWKWNGSGWEFSSTNDPAGSAALTGDLNLDHIINSVDWSYMNSKWFGTDATADLNKDGVVNAIDFSMLNANWQKTW